MPDAPQNLDRLRALWAEAQEAAEQSTDPHTRRVLQFIAAAYERLVHFVEAKQRPEEDNEV